MLGGNWPKWAVMSSRRRDQSVLRTSITPVFSPARMHHVRWPGDDDKPSSHPGQPSAALQGLQVDLDSLKHALGGLDQYKTQLQVASSTEHVRNPRRHCHACQQHWNSAAGIDQLAGDSYMSSVAVPTPE